MENKKAGEGISPSPDLDQEYELRTRGNGKVLLEKEGNTTKKNKKNK